MRTFVWHALVALALGAVAGVCVAGSVLERGIGLAQREVVSLNLIAAERAYADVARHLGYTDKIPWLLRRTRQEIVAKRAAVRYWQGDYASLVNDYANASNPELRNNLALQLTVANASHRAGQSPDATRQEMLDALDRAISSYVQILQDSGGDHDVAFNYEFLVRLRNSVAGGAEWVPRAYENPLGQEGGQPVDADSVLDDVRIYVPMQPDERDPADEPTQGGDPPIRRRG